MGVVMIVCNNCGTNRTPRWHSRMMDLSAYDWCEECWNHCTGHEGLEINPKVCAKCGTHVDEERPD